MGLVSACIPSRQLRRWFSRGRRPQECRLEWVALPRAFRKPYTAAWSWHAYRDWWVGEQDSPVDSGQGGQASEARGRTARHARVFWVISCLQVPLSPRAYHRRGCFSLCAGYYLKHREGCVPSQDVHIVEACLTPGWMESSVSGRFSLVRCCRQGSESLA